MFIMRPAKPNEQRSRMHTTTRIGGTPLVHPQREIPITDRRYPSDVLI
jgi:hypothetical protein